MEGPRSGEPEGHNSTGGGLRQVVHSAEQVALHLPLAGPTSRMAAYALDAILLWSGLMALVLLLLLLTPMAERVMTALARLFGDADGPALGTAFFAALAVAIVVLAFSEIMYFVFWETTTGGRSPGKAVVGLRVVRDGGAPLTLSASLIRNLLRVVDWLPLNYLAGFLAMLVSPEAKRFGDLAAGTVVIRVEHPGAVAPLAVAGGGETSGFRLDRAQLQRLGPTERALLRQTLRRLEDLPAEREAEVLARAVEVLRARLQYGDEVPPAEHRAFLRALLDTSTRR
jgi:uncharacterized RDD family membrane protein YckC